MPNINSFISPVNLTGHNILAVSEKKLSDGGLIKVEVIKKSTSTSFMDKVNWVIEKVKHVAHFILTVSISALLYWVNPSLFAIGFIAGIILDDQVRNAIQKIKDVWKNQKIAGTLMGGFACALSMPVTLAAASILWSAHLGSLMTAKKIMQHKIAV